MRAVVQRVTTARIRVGERLVSEIGPGLVVLLGVAAGDGPEDVAYVSRKIQELRLFNEGATPMARSVKETGGSVLVVSQFTLYGDCRKGRRPSFDQAATADEARVLYEQVIEALQQDGLTVRTGEFQAMMHVHLVNDGPVTVLLDSTRVF